MLKENLIGVDVSHLPLRMRIDAAQWCFEKYGFDSIDIWNDTSDFFYFNSSEQATWFVLKWL